MPEIISRRELLVGTACAATATATAAQPRAPRRIGWLKIQGRSHTPGHLRAFLSGLQALGHKEGSSFLMEARFADGDASRLEGLAEDMVRSRVDLILATSQPATDAARKVTRSIPIVGRMTDDPVVSGAATALSRPGGNVTGIYSLLEEMSGKRLALLKQAVPGVSRVGALLTLSRGATAHWLAESQKAAAELGLGIHTMDVSKADDLDRAFSQAAALGVNGLLAFRNPTVVTHDRRVIDLANQHRMPTVFDAREFADAGGFMSYGPNLDAIFRRLAAYVGQIFGGSAPGEIPIEQPSVFELIVNLKAARTLGITVANTMLIGASEVIE
jgi:putative ABC transport system substrate-binding protein